MYQEITVGGPIIVRTDIGDNPRGCQNFILERTTTIIAPNRKKIYNLLSTTVTSPLSSPFVANTIPSGSS